MVIYLSCKESGAQAVLQSDLEVVSQGVDLDFSWFLMAGISAHLSVLNNSDIDVFFHSRGANFLTQVLLRPGASDLTGSFRYGSGLQFLKFIGN